MTTVTPIQSTVEHLHALAAEWRLRANAQLTERNGMRRSQKALRAQKLRWAQIYNECATEIESIAANLP